MLKQAFLEYLYLEKKKSKTEIAKQLHCSVHQVSYWMSKYAIKTRSISDALYQKNNPNGDPFFFTPPSTLEDGILFGLGMGLYWGEGTKANRSSVRIGNTDPALINVFIRFLVEVFKIKKKNLRFSLLIFSDIKESEAMRFWTTSLGVSAKQFSKATTIKIHRKGTYKNKSRYGVIMAYYHNTKLRNVLIQKLETIKLQLHMPNNAVVAQGQSNSMVGHTGLLPINREIC